MVAPCGDVSKGVAGDVSKGVVPCEVVFKGAAPCGDVCTGKASISRLSPHELQTVSSSRITLPQLGQYKQPLQLTDSIQAHIVICGHILISPGPYSERNMRIIEFNSASIRLLYCKIIRQGVRVINITRADVRYAPDIHCSR